MQQFAFTLFVLGSIAYAASCKTKQDQGSPSVSYSNEAKRSFTIRLDSGRHAPDSFITRFIGDRPYKKIDFSPGFYSITYKDSLNKLPVTWAFVSRNDTLNQYGLFFEEYPVTPESFRLLYPVADSLMKIFQSRFGDPVKSVNNGGKFHAVGNSPFFQSDILKAMWMVDGQKITINFSINGEHPPFHYELKVSRFRNYYGNVELPPWWDGY